MNWHKLLYAIIVFCILASLAIFFMRDRDTKQIHADKGTTTSLYSMSSTSRNSFLLQMIEAKEYQAVINATNDGIQNHTDLVRNDVAFWDHRAMAYYELGNCVDALAAAYHASLIDDSDQLFGLISSSPLCSKSLKK